MNIHQIHKNELYNIANRDQFIKQRQFELMSSSQEYDKLSFQIVTFNVSEAKPENIFSQILVPDKQLYIIALQEISMTVQTILTSKHTTAKAWEQMIRNAVNNTYDIQKKQLGGLLMVIVYKKILIVEEILAVPCGGHNFANKGGINCFIRYKNTRYLFTGSHLAASRKPDGMFKRVGNLERIFMTEATIPTRLAAEEYHRYDTKAICLTTFLKNQDNIFFEYEPQKQLLTNTQRVDFVFMFGDMNFRLQVKNQIDFIVNGQLKELQQFDELLWQMRGCKEFEYVDESTLASGDCQLGYDDIEDEFQEKEYLAATKRLGDDTTSIPDSVNVVQQNFNKLWAEFMTKKKDSPPVIKPNQYLQHFLEEKINFPPTYKLKNGQYNLIRLPAYCDRIIYQQINKDINLKVTEYKSIPQITFSDHLPVMLIGEITARPELILSDAIKQKSEDEWNQLLDILKPEIEFNTKSIVLHKVKFGYIYEQELIITNKHKFSELQLKIKNLNNFLKFQCNDIIVNANCENQLTFYVQILDTSVVPAYYTIQLIGNMIQQEITIEIKDINYKFLNQQLVSNRRVPQVLLNFCRIFLINYNIQFLEEQQNTEQFSKPPEITENNQIYEYLLKNIDFQTDVDVLTKIFLIYIQNFRVLQGDQQEKIRQQLLVKYLEDYSDIWCCFDEVLNIQQRDIILMIQKIIKFVYQQNQNNDYVKDIAIAIFGDYWGYDILIKLIQSTLDE